VQLDAEELAVLGLASRVWQQASLSGPAASALLKLSALGLEPDETSLVGVEPRVRTAEPAFDALYEATRSRTPVVFSYRKPDGTVSERHLEPWAVISRGGRWYVGGRDRDRGAARVFRLSRIDSPVKRDGRSGSYTVPADLEPRDLVAPMRQAPDERRARLRVRAGRGVTLRRRALQVAEPGGTDGWDEVTLQVNDPTSLEEELAGYGPDVVVLAPEDLRQGVIRRLRAALAGSGVAPAPAAARGEDEV